MHFIKLSKMDYQKLKEANDKFAFEQLKIDADKGHLFCQYQVAKMYENGIGIEKNSEKAFEYLDAPVLRVGGLDSPIPFSPILEKQFMAKSRLREKLDYLLRY